MYRTLQFRDHWWCYYSRMLRYFRYQCKLVRNKKWVFVHCQIAGKSNNSSDALPKRNVCQYSGSFKNTTSNILCISFSLQMFRELSSFIKANRLFGFSRSNGFIVTFAASPFLLQKCCPSVVLLCMSFEWAFSSGTISDQAQRHSYILLNYTKLSKNIQKYITVQ